MSLWEIQNEVVEVGEMPGEFHSIEEGCHYKMLASGSTLRIREVGSYEYRDADVQNTKQLGRTYCVCQDE